MRTLLAIALPIAAVALAACGPSRVHPAGSAMVNAAGVSFPIRTMGVHFGGPLGRGDNSEVTLVAADAGDACVNSSVEGSATHEVRVRVFGPPPGRYPVTSALQALGLATQHVATAEVEILGGDDLLATGASGTVTLGEMTSAGLAASVHVALDDGSNLDLEFVAALCQ